MWMKDILENREMRTIIIGPAWRKGNTTSGASQGSVLALVL